MKYLKILLLFVTLNTFAQQGGMWIPSLLEGMNEDEMTNWGFSVWGKGGAADKIPSEIFGISSLNLPFLSLIAL